MADNQKEQVNIGSFSEPYIIKKSDSEPKYIPQVVNDDPNSQIIVNKGTNKSINTINEPSNPVPQNLSPFIGTKNGNKI